MFEAKPGVYVITCRATRQRYVGSTSNCQMRWRAHRSLLGRDKHPNWNLQRLWNRHGEASFEFVVVKYFDVASRRKLIKAERIVLERVKPDLNIVLDPDRCPSLGYCHSEETKHKIGASNSRALKGKPWSDKRRAAHEASR